MWDKIERLDWENTRWETNGNRQSKLLALFFFDQETCKAMSKFINERHGELTERIASFELDNGRRCGGYGGDDSFDDMVYGIIGLGEKMFNEALKDPVTVLISQPIIESFAYSIPSSDDFEQPVIPYTRMQLIQELRAAADEIAEFTYDNSFSFTIGDNDLEFNFDE